MLFWTMKITIISIILIFLVHHILVFLKTNLTTPKIKDLVYAPTQKYDAIFNAMNTNAMNTNAMNTNAMNTNAMNFDIQDQSSHKQNNIFLEPAQPDPVDMKNELKQFMKKQFKENSSVENLSNNSSIQYSTY